MTKQTPPSGQPVGDSIYIYFQMKTFEAELSRATDPKARELLGAISAVVNAKGNIVYHYATGYQSLATDALPIDPNSTFTVGSAGKFTTHVAALQCIDRRLLNLDEPVNSYLLELAGAKVLSRNVATDSSTKPFLLTHPKTEITLRHLLCHSSGLTHESHPMIREWRASTGVYSKKDFHPAINYNSPVYALSNADDFTTPVLFDPGEGWNYGPSIDWTGILISRLTKQPLATFIQENIFTPLNMTSSTYQPQCNPEISARGLQMVRRDGQTVVPVNYPLRELVTSAPDLCALLSDLMSSESKLLSHVSRDALFTPHFLPYTPAYLALRKDTENYAAPAGIPSSTQDAEVNYTLAGLSVEEQLELSNMPRGTVTWNGMPNVVWAMNREMGLGMVWATQLLPVDDEETVGIMMTFFREVWMTFGKFQGRIR